jgi:hypothetical protein
MCSGVGNCSVMYSIGVFGKCLDKWPSHITMLLVVSLKFFLSLLSSKNNFIFIFLENDAYGTFVFIFAIGCTVISNVLLLNVLIAMFK